MSDTPAQEISVHEIPSLLLRMIPESADSIAGTYHLPAQAAVVTEETWVRLYLLLAECFTTPVLMPELENDSPNTGLLTRVGSPASAPSPTPRSTSAAPSTSRCSNSS